MRLSKEMTNKIVTNDVNKIHAKRNRKTEVKQINDKYTRGKRGK